MGEYVTKQIQNSAKVEAAIGIGITTIITTYVVDNAVNGGEMPHWAMAVLMMLLLTFIAVRILAYFRFLVEQETALRAKKVDAEIEQAKVRTQIDLLNAQIRKLEAEKAVQVT